MSRLDGLQEEQIYRRVQTVVENLNAIKTAQLAGSQSLRLNRFSTDAPVDISVPVIYHQTTGVEMTFTSASASDLGQVGLMWRAAISIAFVGAGLSYNSTELLLPDGNTQRVRIYFYGRTPGMTQTVNVTYALYAFGSGTFSAASI